MKCMQLFSQAALLGGILMAVCNPVTSIAQQPGGSSASPIAIVPIDSSNNVSGALQVSEGKAIIGSSGTITSAEKPTDVTLPRRGTLRVCASTSVKLAADTSVPAGETPGLMIALDHGALEASYAAGSNSDVLLTPDFRILIGGPGAVDLKVRLGANGDTCVDNGAPTDRSSSVGLNPGANAPYVLVSSVFEGGAYRVQPGQRVMFQHGSLQEVVDQEKEPCGCPPAPRPGTNDFPLAQSAGLAPLANSAPPPSSAAPTGSQTTIDQSLAYQAPAPAETTTPVAAAPPAAQPAQPASVPHAAPKHPGIFHRVGSFFRRIFGAEQS